MDLSSGLGGGSFAGEAANRWAISPTSFTASLLRALCAWWVAQLQGTPQWLSQADVILSPSNKSDAMSIDVEASLLVRNRNGQVSSLTDPSTDSQMKAKVAKSRHFPSSKFSERGRTLSLVMSSIDGCMLLSI